MVPPGTRFRRKPNRNRTRKDSIIPVPVQQQLLIDLANSDFDEDDPWAILREKPEKYGESGGKLHKSCKDKLRYYLELKKSDPTEYW